MLFTSRTHFPQREGEVNSVGLDCFVGPHLVAAPQAAQRPTDGAFVVVVCLIAALDRRGVAVGEGRGEEGAEG